MIIKKRIKLGNNNYYVCYDCEYKSIDGLIKLQLNNYKDSYYDGGDLSKLILKIEKNYNKNTYSEYANEQWFLSDCLYIYDNIPFISGVGDYYISSSDGIINSVSYISKEELNEYIKNHNVKMKDKTDFKLSDERTWKIN